MKRLAWVTVLFLVCFAAFGATGDEPALSREAQVQALLWATVNQCIAIYNMMVEIINTPTVPDELKDQAFETMEMMVYILATLKEVYGIEIEVQPRVREIE